MKPLRSYIICATPRSGSTLLCDLLADTGVAGRPDSFFRRQSFAEWARYFNTSVADWSDEAEFDQSYLSAVLQEGTGATQVFGMRLMWESLNDLSNRLDLFYPELPSDSARFRAAFGTSTYIHLSRTDQILQAVSRLKAEQTGLWHVAADGSERERTKSGGRPVYDANRLSEILAQLIEQEAAWLAWFAREGIDPVRVTYETLSTDPQTVLATILSDLHLDPSVAKSLEPRTTRLADRESCEWASRFRTVVQATSQTYRPGPNDCPLPAV